MEGQVLSRIAQRISAIGSTFLRRKAHTEEWADRQRFALEAAEAGTWEWSLADGRLVWSRTCRKLYGLDPGGPDPSYQQWLAMMDPADREGAGQAMRDVIERRAADLNIEFRIYHPVKGERWIQSLGRGKAGRDGTMSRMTGVSIDISARRLAEDAVRESEDRYRTLFEMAPVGIIMVEPEAGGILASNSRADDMLGYTPSELLHMKLSDIQIRCDDEPPPPSLREMRNSDRTLQFETRHRCKDGRVVDVLAAAHRVRVGSGDYIYKMWVDMTGPKEVERQLVAAKLEAERADQAKSQFLAAASHDLRQPVQSLMFFHSALVAKLKGHPVAPLLENMQSGLDALTTLLDGLLDISKLHARTVEPQYSAFPLGVLFARLESEYAHRAAEKGVDFRIVPTSAWVRSDIALLERMLRNLVDNALKYTRTGSILLGCRRIEGAVRVMVADTGPGIPENRLEDIFHEFVQLGNPERDRGKGLGLGLAIVRQLSQLLDHRVEVTSRLGHGTSFSLTVPLAKARTAWRRRARSSVMPLLGHNRLALVVDDETLVLTGLRALLEGMGWDVLAARSGDEAVRQVYGNRVPDVIIADYRLCDNETGATVIRDVQRVCGVSVPAVVLTGDTSPDRLVECQRDGYRLMHKPVTPEALGRVLAETQEVA